MKKDSRWKLEPSREGREIGFYRRVIGWDVTFKEGEISVKESKDPIGIEVLASQNEGSIG